MDTIATGNMLAAGAGALRALGAHAVRLKWNPLRHMASQAGSVPEGVRDLLASIHTVPPERTRNFCIVAHIDHGKSTLADRMLEHTLNIAPDLAGNKQVLDNLEVRGRAGLPRAADKRIPGRARARDHDPRPNRLHAVSGGGIEQAVAAQPG